MLLHTLYMLYYVELIYQLLSLEVTFTFHRLSSLSSSLIQYFLHPSITIMLMKKCVVVQKNRESRRQRQSGAAENRPAGLTPRRCGVSLTPAWFEATSLNVNGSPDVPDISMNVTECHCRFLHLQCQHCGASISEAWCC